MSSTVIRKQTLIDNKIKFNPSFEMVEEADVFLKLSYYGKIDFVDQVLSHWRSHRDSTTWTKYHLLHQESVKLKNELIYKFPEITSTCHSELLQFDITVIGQKILSFWLNSENNSMRAYLKEVYSLLPASSIIAYYTLSYINAEKWGTLIFRLKSSVILPN